MEKTMNSYQWAYEKTQHRLRLKHLNQNSLTDEDIDKACSLIEKASIANIETGNQDLIDEFFQPLGYQNYQKLSKDDWAQLNRTLKADFNTSWAPGLNIIVGEKHRKRDNTWWTDRVKREKRNLYWNEYKEYFLDKQFNQNIVRPLENLVDTILNNLGNPEDESFTRYGMIVGHVQSGKTGNYSSLICKAADAGYKFIVVLSGTNINNLRNQTQSRINESFIGHDEKGKCGIGIGNNRAKKDVPWSLTKDTADFSASTAQTMIGGNFDTINVPIILVIKKNASVLRNLTKWLEDQYRDVISDHPMLVIDDESDWGSVNVKDADSPATINKLIRSLLGLFNKSSYVAYTATPFANIFIDYKAENTEQGKDLFPQDFIFPIEAPDNYIGAAKIFGTINEDDNDESEKLSIYLKDIIDNEDTLPLKHDKNFELEFLPESLKEAIRTFIINVAIRNLRGHNEKKHNSMLIHVTLNTNVHMSVHSLVELYLNENIRDVVNFGKLRNASAQSTVFKKLQETFDEHTLYPGIKFSWKEVFESIHNTIGTIITRQVHSTPNLEKLEYLDDSPPINVIVVGGLSLARGFTLEGLSVSYFLRSTKFYDTLMQMGRWFGYRDGYDDLCRIYMTPSKQRHYQHIQTVTEDLFESFKLMHDQKKTPNDFGLAVKEHPDNVLQVTAKNKMKATSQKFISMDLTGKIKETAWISNKEEELQKNLKTIQSFVKVINSGYKYVNISTKKSSSFLWGNINGKLISSFLSDFIVEGASQFILSSKMPIDFVQQFAIENPGKWDVALYGGEDGSLFEVIDGLEIKAQQRKFTDRDSLRVVTNRQVSSGNSESINLPEDVRKSFKSNRRLARAYQDRNNLLMLHILEDKNNTGEMIAAFGVSFSGDGASNRSTKIRMNKVMIDEINKFAEDEGPNNEE